MHNACILGRGFPELETVLFGCPWRNRMKSTLMRNGAFWKRRVLHLQRKEGKIYVSHSEEDKEKEKKERLEEEDSG